MGTHCKKATTQPVVNMLRSLGYDTYRTCWTTNNKFIGTYNYLAIKDFYQDDINWDVVISHSAGGFNQSLTVHGKTQIAINPPYPFSAKSFIFHASDDWLIPTHEAHKKTSKMIFEYKGTHNTMPTKQIKKFLEAL